MNVLRARPLLALGVGVLAAHLWLVAEFSPARLGDADASSGMRRIQVAFVRELAQAAPVRVAPTPAPAPRKPRHAAAPVAAAASAATPAASAPDGNDDGDGPVMVGAPAVPDDLPVAAATSLTTPPPPQPEATAAPAPDAPAPAASAPPSATALAAASSEPPASAPAPFDWPPSTRLTYTLNGNVRGPVQGRARVEWLRSGSRYQVFMEASVGPSVAPLLTRRDSSEGEITAEGLRPRRYELENKVLLRDPRRGRIEFEPDRIVLENGQSVPRPPGVQDAVSQFVHLTWLFTTRPELLTPGRSVEVMLALPRRVEPWIYDVIGFEALDTPAGRVDTVHVKPRRELRPGGDYAAELWIAPSLQFLAVRILVRQDAETFIDMQIDRLPQQAAREPARERER